MSGQNVVPLVLEKSHIDEIISRGDRIKQSDPKYHDDITVFLKLESGAGIEYEIKPEINRNLDPLRISFPYGYLRWAKLHNTAKRVLGDYKQSREYPSHLVSIIQPDGRKVSINTDSRGNCHMPGYLARDHAFESYYFRNNNISVNTINNDIFVNTNKEEILRLVPYFWEIIGYAIGSEKIEGVSVGIDWLEREGVMGPEQIRRRKKGFRRVKREYGIEFDKKSKKPYNRTEPFSRFGVSRFYSFPMSDGSFGVLEYNFGRRAYAADQIVSFYRVKHFDTNPSITEVASLVEKMRVI